MASVGHGSGGHNHNHIGESDKPFVIPTMVGSTTASGGGEEPEALTAGQKMVSAMSGSLLTSLLVTPLDVVRVRLQSQRPHTANVDFSRLARTTKTLTPSQTMNLGVTACCREVFFAGSHNAELCIASPRIDGMASTMAASPESCAVQEVQKKTYNSTFDGLRKIARNEGITTLWRGLSPTLVMTVPANIIYFTGYEWMRYNPMSPFSKLSDESAPLTAGSVARAVAATTVSPIELIRTRMQAVSNKSESILADTWSGVKEMVNTHGYGSLWRGLTLTLWRDVPFSGLYWWGYETMRGKLSDFRDERRGRSSSREETDFGTIARTRRASQSRENHSEVFVDSFISGATSGAFASIVTTPFDVGKTRTQVYRDAPPASAAKAAINPSAQATPEQRHMIRLLWNIFKTEGVAGLWKGWIPRTLKVAPACAIMISSYEVSKRAFRGVNKRASEAALS